ncbi:MAG: 23S rRNA (guanosine(2251)-2'-O)-methyltransferase RlmB [Enterobacterales bacterium]
MSKIIYGIHAIESLINLNTNNIICIYILNNNKRLKFLIEKIKKLDINFKLTNKRYLDKITYRAVHQGCVAYVHNISYKYNESYLLNLFKENKNFLFLILDGITDPHNLGACLRCADAVKANAIIIQKKCSVNINSTVIKVASGAAESVPLISVTNLSRTIKLLKKNFVRIIGTTYNAKNVIFNTKLEGSIAIVVGSENKGIRKLILSYCDELVKIPMNGTINSLNVSVASAICLFEVFRQTNYT